jgi:hypothetical protein
VSYIRGIVVFNVLASENGYSVRSNELHQKFTFWVLFQGLRGRTDVLYVQQGIRAHSRLYGALGSGDSRGEVSMIPTVQFFRIKRHPMPPSLNLEQFYTHGGLRVNVVYHCCHPQLHNLGILSCSSR